MDHGITFPSMAFEDMATTHRLFSHAEKVVVINRALYYYNQQSASTLATINAQKSMTLFWPQLWCVLLWTKTVFMTNIKSVSFSYQKDRLVLFILRIENS